MNIAIEERRQRRRVAMRGPQFEFGIAGRRETHQKSRLIRRHMHRRDGLRVTTVEPFRESKQRGQQTHHPAMRPR